MTDQYLDGRDAAFPDNMRGWPGLTLGYYGGPLAFNVWPMSAWRAFRGPKIPIWVGGYAGAAEGAQAVNILKALRVPRGCETILDMELRVDRTYVQHFGEVLQSAGYKVLVYGSISTLFKNPQLNGYAVADPTGARHMYPHPGVRLTQWAFGQLFDNDVLRHWVSVQGDLWE